MRFLRTTIFLLLLSLSVYSTFGNDSDQIIHIINAFSFHDQGGNPAALVLNSDNLSKEKMQEIAKKVGDLGLARMTAFISEPENPTNDYKLQFFTPVKQIPHCGHATLATFIYLSQNMGEKKLLFIKESIDGTRKIVFKDDTAFMEQRAPTYQNPFVSVSMNQLGRALQISPQNIITTPHPEIVRTGNGFLVIGVKSTDILQKIRPNLSLIKEISEKFDLVAFYVFSPGKNNIDAEARMFGPRYGINEESASGTAAGALACFLYDKCNFKKESFEIEQGRFMVPPSVSRIFVSLETKDKQIRNLLVGGNAHYVKQIVLNNQ